MPDLLSLYREIILRNIEDLEGVRVGGINVNNFGYADDAVLLADSEEKVLEILNIVTRKSESKV